MADLIERLRKVDGSKPDYTGIQTLWNRNPDGPEAADRIEALESVLREAGDTFRQYEALHMAKGTLDGEAKAYRNACLADKIDAILSKNEEKKHG